MCFRNIVIVMLLLLTGCAGVAIRNNTDKLNSTLKEYGADMRWGRMNYAYNYHVNREGTRPVVDLEALEQFNVTGFRPVDPVLNDEATEAVVPVEIDYYDREYGTVRKIKTTQNWYFDPEAKNWLTESAFPEFK